MKVKHIIGVLLVFLFSCEESDLVDKSGKISIETTALPQLTSGNAYKVWIHTQDIAVYVGQFTIDENGTPSQTVFRNIEKTDLELASEVFITLSNSSSNLAVTDCVILSGNFNQNQVSLSTVATPLENPSGTFRVYTPSTSTTADELSGIWFETLTNLPSLSLEFGDDFVYQAWIINEDEDNLYYLDMGTFGAASGRDNFNIFISDELPIPHFPGEDFINNILNLDEVDFPLDLAGKKLRIEMVPKVYESNEMPFGFPVLEYSLTASLNTTTDYTLIPSFSGTATATRSFD